MTDLEYKLVKMQEVNTLRAENELLRMQLQDAQKQLQDTTQQQEQSMQKLLLSGAYGRL